MNYRETLKICLLPLLLLGFGCRNKEAQEDKPAPVVEAPKQQPPVAKRDPLCLGSIAKGTTAEALTINGAAWELDGSTMTQKTPKGDSIVIGAISDIKEDSEENLQNLRRFTAWFTQNKVDLIVVAGDTGETAPQIENALGVLAETKVPVFAIIGNREGRAAFKTAMDNLRAKYGNVFNLNTIRRIDTGAVDILSMPGYFNPHYVHAEDGCRYQPADVTSLAELAKASNSKTLVISHGGPKQEGALALDRTSEGDNVGDPEMAKVIAQAGIPFGIFGNIHEAGGRATNLAGTTVIKPGELVDSMYLHPGPADAVRWGMNDKSESVGMASIVTIKAGQAKYEVLKMEDPERKPGQKRKGRK